MPAKAAVRYSDAGTDTGASEPAETITLPVEFSVSGPPRVALMSRRSVTRPTAAPTPP